MSVANLLTVADSGFESGIADWIPGGFTQVAQSGTQFHSGSKSMAVTSLPGGNSTAILNVLIPVLPGAIINPNSWFWAGNVGQSAQFNLVWYASDKLTILSNSFSTITTIPVTTWAQVTSNGIQAPTNAFWVQLQIIITGNNPGNITYVDDDALGWGNYATNMCPNPSFELDLTGWSGTRGNEVLTQVNTYDQTTYQVSQSQSSQPGFLRIFAGNSALQVSTPGHVANEGVFGPSTWMPVTTTGSMSCNLFGETGTVVVQAVDQITGSILGQQIITLAGGSNWYNATIPNLTFVAGHTYYIQIITYGPVQTLTFMVDGVMYQPEAPTPYVDGDTLQGIWTGTAEESASYQPYQFGIVSTCKFLMSGACNINTVTPGSPIIAVNAQASALEFFIGFGPILTQGGNVALSIVSPSAAMTDFGIWQGGALGTDLDPAMAYSTWNTTLALSGLTAYTRPYMAVTPSLDMFTSSGGLNWKRSAYMAYGLQWLSVSNNTAQIITDVQTELLPINGVNQVTPRAYQSARQLQTIVKPDRLNYVTNPSFLTGATTNWSQIGTTQTLSISGNTPVIPNLPFPLDGTSMAVTVASASGTGVQITINQLIPGRTYMCSMWIQPDGSSMGDITGTCGSGSGTMTGSAATGYGSGGFGAGPYGGITLTTTPLSSTWQQLFFSFQATTDSHTLQVSPVNVAAPVFPYTWFIDAVLIEDGDILNPYFDGNSGVDALWLDGGTPGLCQSFYYNQLEFARHIIVDSLASNTPLGITYAQPQYAVMPTQ